MPNNPDPRLEAAIRRLHHSFGFSRQGAEYAATSVIAAIDAADPMRQPPSDEAMEPEVTLEPVWPHPGCIKRCHRYNGCQARTFICPHAGERADG